MTPPTTKLVLTLSLFITPLVTTGSAAFHHPVVTPLLSTRATKQQYSHRRTTAISLSSQKNEDDDEFADGVALSREFSRQVKKRGLHRPPTPPQRSSPTPSNNNLLDDDDDKPISPLASEDEDRFTDRRAFLKRREVRNGRDVPRPLSVKEDMFMKEMNLVDRAGNERTLGVQAVLALGVLAFFLYVGLTGGITDGADRFAGVDWEVFGEGFEAPGPSSVSGESVWL